MIPMTRTAYDRGLPLRIAGDRSHAIVIPMTQRAARLALLFISLFFAAAGPGSGQDLIFDRADTTIRVVPPADSAAAARDGTRLFNAMTAETATAPAQDSLRLLDPRSSLPDSLREDDQSFRLFLDKIEVEGKLEKPQAIFIIPGSDPEIDDIQIKRSFFEEIFRPVAPSVRIGVKQKPSSTSKRKDVFPW